MNRSAVILNCLSLVCLVAYYEFLVEGDRDPVLFIYAIIPFLVFLITLVKFYILGGLWKYMRKMSREGSAEKIAPVSTVSYSIFTVTCLITLMLYFLLKIPLNMVLIVSLLYLAHILPAYIVNWEKTQTVQ